MNRADGALLAVVVCSVALGGVSAATFGTHLQRFDAVEVVAEQVHTEITGVEVDSSRLRVNARISNPTAYRLRLEGTFLQAFDESGDRLAYGSATHSPGTTIPSRDHLDVVLVVELTPGQADRLASALDSDGFTLTGRHGVSLGETPFTVSISPVPIDAEGAQ